MATFTSSELELMGKAAKVGGELVAECAGTRAKQKELDALALVVMSGKDVPIMALKTVCVGLECIYWHCQDAPKGIAALLAKLERMTGYIRMGMATLDSDEAGYIARRVMRAA